VKGTVKVSQQHDSLIEWKHSDLLSNMMKGLDNLLLHELIMLLGLCDSHGGVHVKTSLHSRHQGVF
jgi:hypothetical protein